MSERQRFEWKLICPSCGRKGTAKLSKAAGSSYPFGDQTTSVDLLPEGFKVVSQENNLGTIDIFCENCSVSAAVE